MKYTIAEFNKEYPNDAVCLDKIFQIRFGDLKVCPHCKSETKFRRISTRRAYQCRLCYGQLYPCAGTPFERTRTPLNYWFYAMYMMTTTRNGVSAKEIERCLGVTYKTAFKMAKQIRVLMGYMKTQRKLTGVVEMDETYIGGRRERNNSTKGQIAPMKPKTPVFAMVERLGEVRAQKIERSTMKLINPIIENNVDKSAKISTDESPLYTNLPSLGYENHGTVKHSAKQYRYGDICTNTIEGFFGQLKRMIDGTHIHVSDKHLQKYVDEACFRYNNRHKEIDMFGTLVLKISTYEA